MSKTFTLDIPGDPVAKGRPRVYRGHGITPPRTVSAENRVYAAFIARYPDMKPVGGPVDVYAGFWLSRRGKPDIDNMIKLILDALNRVAWRDDAQITRIIASKTVPDLMVPGARPGTWRHRKTGDPLTSRGKAYEPHIHLEIIETSEWTPEETK